MADFFRTSTVWVVDFSYDGRARRLYRAFPLGTDVLSVMRQELLELHGDRAQMHAARQATDAEDLQYVRGELPKKAWCPTGH